MTCNCGHPKSEHKGSSGPNSIGRWNFGECVHGSQSDGYYRFGGCKCYGFRRSIWLSIRAQFAAPSAGTPNEGGK